MAQSKTVYVHTCKRCHRHWETLNKEPVTCRFCKSYLWNEEPRR